VVKCVLKDDGVSYKKNGFPGFAGHNIRHPTIGQAPAGVHRLAVKPEPEQPGKNNDSQNRCKTKPFLPVKRHVFPPGLVFFDD
jgi:hypothetical protein